MVFAVLARREVALLEGGLLRLLEDVERLPFWPSDRRPLVHVDLVGRLALPEGARRPLDALARLRNGRDDPALLERGEEGSGCVLGLVDDFPLLLLAGLGFPSSVVVSIQPLGLEDGLGASPVP